MNALFERAGDSWLRFRSAVDRLSPDMLDSPTTAGWTAKEMIGHLAFWCEAAEAVIVAMFRGEPLRADFAFGSGYVSDPKTPWPDADTHNAREADWARSQTAVAVIARLDAGHARFEDILASLRPEELTDERYQNYVRDWCVEFDTHLLELTALLGETEPPPDDGSRSSGSIEQSPPLDGTQTLFH